MVFGQILFHSTRDEMVKKKIYLSICLSICLSLKLKWLATLSKKQPWNITEHP